MSHGTKLATLTMFSVAKIGGIKRGDFFANDFQVPRLDVTKKFKTENST